jgi:hypothetical protein
MRVRINQAREQGFAFTIDMLEGPNNCSCMVIRGTPVSTMRPSRTSQGFKADASWQFIACIGVTFHIIHNIRDFIFGAGPQVRYQYSNKR